MREKTPPKMKGKLQQKPYAWIKKTSIDRYMTIYTYIQRVRIAFKNMNKGCILRQGHPPVPMIT